MKKVLLSLFVLLSAICFSAAIFAKAGYNTWKFEISPAAGIQPHLDFHLICAKRGASAAEAWHNSVPGVITGGSYMQFTSNATLICPNVRDAVFSTKKHHKLETVEVRVYPTIGLPIIQKINLPDNMKYQHANQTQICKLNFNPKNYHLDSVDCHN